MAPSAMLPDDAPLWRRHLHGDGFGYGWLLLLIMATIAFQMAAPDTDWAQVLSILLQGFTLIAALVVSGVRRWLIHLATVITVIALLTAVGIVIGSGELDVGGGRVLSLMLALLAPLAIAAGVVRQARNAQMITLRTMFGVLCIYLLIGTAFAYAYGLIAAVEDGGFFAEISGGSPPDFLYFSFTTMTTTGFGDLTAAENLGRSLAITEALIGQIYLVTLVALIVSNLGRTRPLG
jgi:Ion channel